MALFHTTVVDNQIKALLTIGSASGSIATFDTDRADRLVNLEVAITATGGGGTPVSPIAINGFSACNLSVNGTTETISFGQTVYGGRLNVGSGVLTVTHGYATVGSMGWGVGDYFYSSISDKAVGNFNIISDNYATTTSPSASGMGNWEIKGNATTNSIYLKDNRYSTVTDLINNMGSTLLVYELATPFTIQLDSKQIQAIIGTNNVYSDTGDIIDLKFVLSVGKVIS